MKHIAAAYGTTHAQPHCCGQSLHISCLISHHGTEGGGRKEEEGETLVISILGLTNKDYTMAIASIICA